MSKLDEIFKNELPEAYEIHGFENTKQKIKALFLELIGDVKLFPIPTDEELGAYHLRCDLRKKVQDL